MRNKINNAQTPGETKMAIDGLIIRMEEKRNDIGKDTNPKMPINTATNKHNDTSINQQHDTTWGEDRAKRYILTYQEQARQKWKATR